MFSVIIENATIVDGTGNKPYKADIAILNDRISYIGDCNKIEATQRINAESLVVLPGFIDVHTHSDVIYYTQPNRDEAICQGITTEITGSCGIGTFPLSRSYDDYEPTMRGILGHRISRSPYKSTGEYLSSLPKTGLNVAAQLAHSPLRAEAVGYSDVPLVGESLKSAINLMKKSLDEGAVSFSTGLSYYPASFGDTEELVELCKVAKQYDVPICAHLRSVLRKPIPNYDKRNELLEIGERTGIRIHYSHYRTTPDTVGNLHAHFAPIERGLSEGLSVTADIYPYPIGAGFCPVYLPLWAMDGGYSSIMKRLQDKSMRKQIIEDLSFSFPPIQNGRFLHAPHHPEYLGRTYQEIAKERNQTIAEMLVDLLREEELNLGFSHGEFTSEQERALEKDFTQILSKPYYMGGSDAIAVHSFPHPRTFGAFSKLVRLCYEHSVPIEIVANRLSNLPAQLFQLKDRGEIAVGKFADLCLFTPGNPTDMATFSDPQKLAIGMEHVIINGDFVLKNGELTGTLAGRPLFRGR